MSRLKSKYKSELLESAGNAGNAENAAAENPPADSLEINSDNSDIHGLESNSSPPDNSELPPQSEPPVENSLSSQLDALHRAESLQHDQRQQQQMDPRRIEWLRATPLAQEYYDQLGPLHHEAVRHGHGDMSPEYFEAMEIGLRNIVSQQQPQSEPPMPEPQRATREPAPMQPTPSFFAPPQVRMPATRAPSAASIVSAPVSRGVPDGNMRHSDFGDGRVHLTQAEVDAARTAGVTLKEYVEGKRRLAREREAGAAADMSSQREIVADLVDLILDRVNADAEWQPLDENSGPMIEVANSILIAALGLIEDDDYREQVARAVADHVLSVLLRTASRRHGRFCAARRGHTVLH